MSRIEQLIKEFQCSEYRHIANEPQFDCDMVEFQKEDLFKMFEQYRKELLDKVVENATASIDYVDFYDFSCGIEGCSVDTYSILETEL